jgi:hypothetical protein
VVKPTRTESGTVQLSEIGNDGRAKGGRLRLGNDTMLAMARCALLGDLPTFLRVVGDDHFESALGQATCETVGAFDSTWRAVVEATGRKPMARQIAVSGPMVATAG